MGRKRAAGVGASALVLLAGCAKVVSSHGAPDPVALASYLSSSSSSAASASAASSSKAAAARQTICSNAIIGFARVSNAWGDFAAALNKGTAAAEQVDPLRTALRDGSAQMRSAEADPDSELGKAAGEYADALDSLAEVFTKKQFTSTELNNGHARINTTADALIDVCKY